MSQHKQKTSMNLPFLWAHTVKQPIFDTLECTDSYELIYESYKLLKYILSHVLLCSAEFKLSHFCRLCNATN